MGECVGSIILVLAEVVYGFGVFGRDFVECLGWEVVVEGGVGCGGVGCGDPVAAGTITGVSFSENEILTK